MSGREAVGRLQVFQIYRLLQYAYEGDKAHIEKMVNLGVENLINLTEPQHGTAVLHVAVSTNSRGAELVSFLLSKGAEPNIQNKKGCTPIMLAAELGNDAIMQLLVQKNANFTLQDSEGRGVLFYCIYPTKRHIRCLQLALKHQADPNNVSADGTHIFQQMCAKVQLPMCLIMLDAGTDPNAANQKTGVTALMEAAKAGSSMLVRAILNKGANPNALDFKHFTAVHYAAIGGYFEVIQVLSAHSADMGVVNLENCTPLHYAAANGNANCCKFLAQRGCNPKLKNQEGFLPRQIAKNAGHKAAAKELRKAEKQHGKGNNPSGNSLLSDLWALTLHDWSNEFEDKISRAFGDTDSTVTADVFISVLELLNAPVELDQLQTVIAAHDQSNSGGVHIKDFIRGVKYIKKPFLVSSYMPKKKKEKSGKGGKKKKKKGKFVLPLPICTLPTERMTRRPDGGPPCFMIEAYTNFSDRRRFNHDHPPQHPLMNDSGWYLEKPETVYVSISYCAKTGDLESLDLAFNQGVPVDVQDPFYKTPLMVACSSGNYEVAQYLLSKGANVNARDQFFWTPLHHAAFAGQKEIIELLLDAGAAINAQALSGGTPLMRAIECSSVHCVEFLIKAGANVRAENKKAQTCLDVARAFADTRVIDLIKESLPEPKEPIKKRGVSKPKSAKDKTVAAESAAPTETATASGMKSAQKDSKSVILHNSKITSEKTNTVDISFVPKSVWGTPATTSQLMSKIERRKKLLSLEMDLDDFMMPFNHNTQKMPGLAKTTV